MANNKRNNDELSDIISNINEIAKQYGFINGKAWIEEAYRKHEVTIEDKTKYFNKHILRNCGAHGSAGDISPSTDTINFLRHILNVIKRSKCRGKYKNDNRDFHKSNTHRSSSSYSPNRPSSTPKKESYNYNNMHAERINGYLRRNHIKKPKHEDLVDAYYDYFTRTCAWDTILSIISNSDMEPTKGLFGYNKKKTIRDLAEYEVNMMDHETYNHYLRGDF